MILTHGANSIGGGGSILPEGYQQLKYIHFQGTTSSYLYTAYGITNNYRIELKGKVNSFTNNGVLFKLGQCGVLAQTSNQYVRVRNTDSQYFGYDNTYDKSILLNDFTMVLEKNQFVINNETPKELSIYSSTSGQLSIGLPPSAANNYYLYSIKFTNLSDGTVAFHFIPCKELSTGRYGLYEIIFNGFTLGTNVAP